MQFINEKLGVKRDNMEYYNRSRNNYFTHKLG